ncbi:hypothetical protein GCM10023196_049930 [Actinoallomurus vinaceus]|uniref:Uncharacterized protein n=1 Tax=Actinoallomurus vinaceus TaxID=1080074 RepID=A0ABP8UEU2_9ACTN
MLCVWNAYALQTLGEHLLDAIHPYDDGNLPSGAAARTLAFLGQVERWLFHARRIAIDSTYRIEDHVHLPADPPTWRVDEPSDRRLLAATATAARAIHARGLVALVRHADVPGIRSEDRDRLRRILGRAGDAIEYAARASLDGDPATMPTPPDVHLRYAIRTLYAFGQYLAMPHLLDGRDATRAVSLAARVVEKTDPWCLTDPDQRPILQSLPGAHAVLERMWAADSCRAATVRVQAQIAAALRLGAIVFAVDRAGERLGCFHRCPWPAVYEVRRPVTIGGIQLWPLQHFTYDVTGPRETDLFARRILVSVFTPAEDRPIGW